MDSIPASIHLHWLPVALLMSLCCPEVRASEAHAIYDQLYTVGSGSIFLNYQYINVNDFQNGVEKVHIGEVRTQSLYLQIDYAVADRWRLEFGLPVIKRRYIGPGVHDPLKLIPPRPEVELIDDGSYHTEFQDFYFGIDYLWVDKPVRLEPFVHVFIPSHDYPHFGNAAVGQNLWKVEIGMELTHFMPFSDWYYRLGGGYTIVEQTLDVSVNHFRLNGELGYFLAPNFAVNAFFLARKGNGDSAQNFPPPSRTDERWYQHDRTTRHNSANVGMGADWFFSEDYQLSVNAFTTVWGDSVHWVDIAADIGITRYF